MTRRRMTSPAPECLPVDLLQCIFEFVYYNCLNVCFVCFEFNTSVFPYIIARFSPPWACKCPSKYHLNEFTLHPNSRLRRRSYVFHSVTLIALYLLVLMPPCISVCKAVLFAFLCTYSATYLYMVALPLDLQVQAAQDLHAHPCSCQSRLHVDLPPFRCSGAP